MFHFGKNLILQQKLFFQIHYSNLFSIIFISRSCYYFLPVLYFSDFILVQPETQEQSIGRKVFESHEIQQQNLKLV